MLKNIFLVDNIKFIQFSGARFSNHQSKVGLIKILEKYSVHPCEKTEIPYKIHPTGFLLAPLNGIHLKFSKV